MRKWWRPWRIIAGGLVAIILFAIYFLILQMTGNFHTVVPGELYRSAQLEPGDITRYVHEHGIKSVLNLRGENSGSVWYDDELRETKSLGVVHLNFRMSSSHELTQEQAIALIDMMRAAPKPLLIHCRAGADRTGLASAFYVAAIAHQSEWAAERQLWMIYGHLPLWINAAFAMNRTFERLEPYLGYNDS